METRAPHLTLLTRCPGSRDSARSELQQVRVKPWVRIWMGSKVSLKEGPARIRDQSVWGFLQDGCQMSAEGGVD